MIKMLRPLPCLFLLLLAKAYAGAKSEPGHVPSRYAVLIVRFIHTTRANTCHHIQAEYDTVTYPEVGTFTDAYPFTSPCRPLPRLPWSPSSIGTQFWLYTRYNAKYQLLDYDDTQSILNSEFSANRKTKFIVHGYISSGNSAWIPELKNAILSADNVNVIVVDWSSGAATADYPQAASNTQVVGAQIGLLIDALKTTTGASYGDFHIMGHSLGAHTGGYAGEKLKEFNFGRTSLGRITGMDPAHPYFQDTEPIVRLDPTDALFVDAIHTDGDPFVEMGWGMIQAVGHADFYPNGGYDQPGCPGNENAGGDWWQVTCSHDRAHELMTDSITRSDVPMYGHECASYDRYERGLCSSCPFGGCPVLGY